MSDFCIYLKLPDYEREWCITHFGNPCEFPSHSNLNAVIRHFIKLRPVGILPETQENGELAVCIPSSASKPPRSYNHLTDSGKKAIVKAIDDLFVIHLWEDLTGPGIRHVRVSDLLKDWMKTNGVSYYNYDNLRMKFARIQRSYRSHGVNVSRRYKH